MAGFIFKNEYIYITSFNIEHIVFMNHNISAYRGGRPSKLAQNHNIIFLGFIEIFENVVVRQLIYHNRPIGENDVIKKNALLVTKREIENMNLNINLFYKIPVLLICWNTALLGNMSRQRL